MRVLLGGILTFLGSATSLSQPLFARQILTDLTLRRPVAPLLITLTTVVLVGAVVAALGYYSWSTRARAWSSPCGPG